MTAFDQGRVSGRLRQLLTNNTGTAQNYPTAVAAPVNSETGEYLPALQSVGMADMTGQDIPSPFDQRFQHGAAEARRIAANIPRRSC
jgi:hypothetical protein